VLKDTVSGKQKKFEKTIENKSYEFKEYFKDDDKILDGWVEKYYKDPRPEEAIDVLLKYSKKGHLAGVLFRPR